MAFLKISNNIDDTPKDIELEEVEMDMLPKSFYSYNELAAIRKQKWFVKWSIPSCIGKPYLMKDIPEEDGVFLPLEKGS